jgi:hypothetical protein
MKTLAAHGLAGGIVQDRMGGSFGAGFLSGSLGSYLGSSGHSKNMFEMIGNTAREAVVGGTISVTTCCDVGYRVSHGISDYYFC